MTLVEKVTLCLENRERIAGVVAQTLQQNPRCSEVELHAALNAALSKHPDFYPTGWYEPPPQGAAVLFANADDQFERSKFPTLRTEFYWPKANYSRELETVGMIYVSPVHKATGLICDIGFNFYQGSDKKVQDHLRHSLETIEAIADIPEVGMAFNQLHGLAQSLVDKQGIHNNWMITMNDPTRGANFGHTLPWTSEEPTLDEQSVIDSGDFDKLKQIISRKRLFINPIEQTQIPETIAFSIEARLGSNEHPETSCGYYYMVVAFRAGEKTVVSNLKPIFEALDITYMKSRF